MVTNSSATLHHWAARSMSLASSQAFNMSQQVYTTVSNVERSPASAAAIASSINANPSPISPLATLTSPSCDSATSSKSTSPDDCASSTAAAERLSAAFRSAIR